jgi:hypothetical protein
VETSLGLLEDSGSSSLHSPVRLAQPLSAGLFPFAGRPRPRPRPPLPRPRPPPPFPLGVIRSIGASSRRRSKSKANESTKHNEQTV